MQVNADQPLPKMVNSIEDISRALGSQGAVTRDLIIDPGNSWIVWDCPILTIHTRICNIGTASVNASHLGYYLSTDDIITIDDKMFTESLAFVRSPG